MHPSRPGKAARGTLLAVLLLAGCAGVPYQEMSDARQAIDAARPVVEEGSDESAQVRRARRLLEQAETHLHDGQYDSARALAQQARDLAIEAREAAEQGNQ